MLEKKVLGKIYKLKAHEIAPIALGRGGCLATDRITVDGEKVGYMYREASTRAEDSGWRFFAGDENQDYMNDPQRHGVYDVNTIVNYDPDVLPLLDNEAGSRFERDAKGVLRRLRDDE
ncbi:DUF2185 domain-containing protein [Flavisphingomonas formosensis]|uniref:DUF2185 domain-containing protein n=1 Tax=Flavisphingomonas formosensis TaxID=861534 RepID=UPI0012F722A7|nr:DUF2185 domain-containing protein [Sphingomonas formosensis]